MTVAEVAAFYLIRREIRRQELDAFRAVFAACGYRFLMQA